MLIDGPNRFCQVSVHLLVSDVESDIIVMNDPGKNWILRKIVVGPVCDDIDKIQVLNIGDFAIGPHVHDIP
jgi:hypothetical protein